MKLTSPVVAAVLLIGTQAFAHGTGYKSSMKEIPHTNITFNPGSSLLTDADKASLKKVVEEARKKGTLDQVTVAAWSDKAMPRKGENLMEQDRNLADRRAKAIEDSLKSDFEVTDVKTYNMAENSNWLARTFNTKDAELKSVFGKKGAATPMRNNEFMLIKEVGGPSEAVVTAELKIP